MIEIEIINFLVIEIQLYSVHKCGKSTKHFDKDCHTSRCANRYILPKTEKPARVNTIEKFCTYYKRQGIREGIIEKRVLVAVRTIEKRTHPPTTAGKEFDEI